jgi:hypothetical protein
MSYKFNFDFTKVSEPLLRAISRLPKQEDITKKIDAVIKNISGKLTNFSPVETTTVIRDIVDIHERNQEELKKFEQSNGKRVLFLPHCCRKYMDSNCKASFDSEASTYNCNHCSADCQINQATALAKARGYDVYVTPGGSCIPKIIQSNDYSATVGVACPQEIKGAIKELESTEMPIIGIPLLKNGCSNTEFDFSVLEEVL